MRGALQMPTRQIVANTGGAGAIVVGQLLETGDVNYGYDAQSGRFTDMVEAGIIDPTKVVRLALQGAASVASLLITTEVMVAEKSQHAVKGTGSGMEDMGF